MNYHRAYAQQESNLHNRCIRTVRCRYAMGVHVEGGIRTRDTRSVGEVTTMYTTNHGGQATMVMVSVFPLNYLYSYELFTPSRGRQHRESNPDPSRDRRG